MAGKDGSEGRKGDSLTKKRWKRKVEKKSSEYKVSFLLKQNSE